MMRPTGWRWWMALGALNGFLAVAAGAFGAHALKKAVAPEDVAVFELGAQYHMYHALALVGVGWLVGREPSRAGRLAGWCFLVGIIGFSGSLYAMILTGVRSLAWLTPLGGVSLLAGWFLFLCAAWPFRFGARASP